MQHPDDGLLEEYLDGELDGPATDALESHLATCDGCRRRVAHARAMAAEAMALVEALGDVPATAPPHPVPARRPPWRALAWAATLVLAAGLGYATRPGLKPSPAPAPGQVEQAPATLPPAAPPAPQPTSELRAAPPAAAREEAAAAAAVPQPAQVPTPPTEMSGRDMTAKARSEAEAAEPAAVAPAAPLARAMNEADRARRLQDAERQAAAPAPSRQSVANLLGGTLALIDGMPVDSMSVGEAPAGEVPGPAVLVHYPDGVSLLQWRVDGEGERDPVDDGQVRRWVTAAGLGLELRGLDPERRRRLAERVR